MNCDDEGSDRLFDKERSKDGSPGIGVIVTPQISQSSFSSMTCQSKDGRAPPPLDAFLSTRYSKLEEMNE